MSSDEQAIRQLVERWMAASRRGDTAAVLDVMADDVVFMVPGKPPFGRQEFAAASVQTHDLAMDGKSEIQEIQIAGEWAWMRTRLEVKVTRPNGEMIKRLAGFTLSILRKERDGQWRILRDANLLSPVDGGYAEPRGV